MSSSYDRRKFIKNSALAGIGVSLADTPAKLFANENKSVVRLGMIAVGMRGQTHLEEMLKRKDVEIIAMADPDKSMMALAQKLVAKYNKKLRSSLRTVRTIITTY